MFSFPWSNFHELNLDWILSVVKEAKDIFVKGEGDIQHAVETADQALETAEQAAAGVIADGAVTIPKVNDDVFNLMAFIVSGSVNPVAIPAGSLVILRKSTVYNVSDGIYIAASDIQASSVLTAADLLQPSPLPDAGGLNYVLAQIGDTETAINAIERGLVTVVDGDTATSAVPVGALAYLKNNTHNLQEGIYANISNAPFPTTGGTADSTVFSAVPNVLNSIRDITGDGALTNFTATDLTGAANELKTALTAETTARENADTALQGVVDKCVTGAPTVEIPANSDLNDYWNRPGTYYVLTDAIATTILNMPRPASGTLIQINRSGSPQYSVQLYITTSANPIVYIRNYNAGTWTSWMLQAHYEVHSGSARTSAGGTASFANTYTVDEWACASVAAVDAVSGYLLLPYKYGDSANGRWGFKAVLSGSLQPIAETNISYVAVMIHR